MMILYVWGILVGVYNPEFCFYFQEIRTIYLHSKAWFFLFFRKWKTSRTVFIYISILMDKSVQCILFYLFIYLFFNLILFNFTILYWFCHISKSICHRYTCVPHPELSSLLPPHTIPLGSSQCTSPKHPVSCIEPGLATRFIYDIIHISMPLF